MVVAKTLGFIFFVGILGILDGAPLETDAGQVSPVPNATQTSPMPTNLSESSTPAQHKATREMSIFNSSSPLNATTPTSAANNKSSVITAVNATLPEPNGAPLLRTKRQQEIPDSAVDVTEYTTSPPTLPQDGDDEDSITDEGDSSAHKREAINTNSTSTSELSNNTSVENPSASPQLKRQSSHEGASSPGQNFSVIHLPENLSPSNMTNEQPIKVKRSIWSAMTLKHSVSSTTPVVPISNSTLTPGNTTATNETMISQTEDTKRLGDEMNSNATNTTSNNTTVLVTQVANLTKTDN